MEYYEHLIDKYSKKPKPAAINPDEIDRTIFPYRTHTKWRLYDLKFYDDSTLMNGVKIWDIERIKATNVPAVEPVKPKKKIPQIPYMEDVDTFKINFHRAKKGNQRENSREPPDTVRSVVSQVSHSIFDETYKSQKKDEDAQPIFGYPMLNFEDPTPEITKKRQSGKYLDRQTILAMEEFAANKHHYNWSKIGKAATGVGGLDNYYELKRTDNAYRIIELCFAKGYPLQRNPVPEDDQRKAEQEERFERNRFEFYRRVAKLASAKSKSVAGSREDDRTPFEIPWANGLDTDRVPRKKGHGYLNRFKAYKDVDKEKIDIGEYRPSSHDAFTFHKPVPANFDRKNVLPVSAMRKLHEMGAAILRRRKREEARARLLKEIAQHTLHIIVRRSAKILFDTPVPSEVPADSFADDYEIDEYRRAEEDLKLVQDLTDISTTARERLLHEQEEKRAKLNAKRGPKYMSAARRRMLDTRNKQRE